MKRCIHDVCRGRNPNNFVKILKDLNKHRRKFLRHKENKDYNLPREVCTSISNSHFRLFNKREYDFHRRGDYLLYNSNLFEIQIRRRRYKRSIVNKAVALLVHHQKVEIHGKKPGFVRIDGYLKHLSVGQRRPLKKGGSVKRLKKNQMVINTFERGFVHVYFTSSYLNLIVKVPKHDVKVAKGMCVSERSIKKGNLFFVKYKKHRKHRIIHIHRRKRCDRKEGKRQCQKAGVSEKKNESLCV